MFLREVPPVEEFDPDALAEMHRVVDQLPTCRRQIDSEHALTRIYNLRPHIGAALADTEGMPEMLDVMTRMNDAQQDYRLGQKLAFETAYAGAQMVSLHCEALQEISARNDAIGSQALRLLYDSALHMTPHGERLDFLAQHLRRFATEEARHPGHDQSRSHKYGVLGEIFAGHSEGEQTESVMDAIEALTDDEVTGDLGRVMQQSVAAKYLRNCPPFVPGETGNGHITYAEYLKFQVRLQNCLGRSVIRAKYRGEDEVDSDLQALIQIADTRGLTDTLWADALQCVAEPFFISWVSEELASRALAHYGIAYEELRDAWMIGGASRVNYRYSFDQYIRDNLRIIQELETGEPGSARALMEEFGICNFSRYPVGMLLKQFRERDNKDLDYGVIIYALDDHNSALEGQYMAPCLEDLDHQLEALQCHARIYECGNRQAVLRALLQARYRYQRQLAFGLCVAHGWVEGMKFSDRAHTGQSVTKLGIELAMFTRAAERYASLFAPGAGGALNSCNTGTISGIAESLATLLGIPIMAPEVPVSKGSITAERRGQGINLLLAYPRTTARVCLPDSLFKQLIL